MDKIEKISIPTELMFQVEETEKENRSKKKRKECKRRGENRRIRMSVVLSTMTSYNWQGIALQQ